MVLTNSEIAILTKFNELTERFGLKPYEFVAECKPAGNPNSPSETELAICVAPKSPDRQALLDKLMDAIGIPDDGALRGTDEEIYNALEAALQRAPRARTGGDWGRFSNN